MTWQMMKVIRMVHRMRPQLLEVLNRYRDRRAIYHLRSPRQYRRFLREHCRSAPEERSR
jgi:hypothetical protein